MAQSENKHSNIRFWLILEFVQAKARFIPRLDETVLHNQWLAVDTKCFTDLVQITVLHRAYGFVNHGWDAVAHRWFVYFSVLFIWTSLFYLGLQILHALLLGDHNYSKLLGFVLHCFFKVWIICFYVLDRKAVQYPTMQCTWTGLPLCHNKPESFLAYCWVWLPTICKITH